MTPEIEPTNQTRKELPDMAKNELADGARLNEAIDKMPKYKRDRLTQAAKELLAREVAPSMKLEMKDDLLSIGLEGEDLATFIRLSGLRLSSGQNTPLEATDERFHFPNDFGKNEVTHGRDR